MPKKKAAKKVSVKPKSKLKPKAGVKPRALPSADFASTFAALKQLLSNFASELHVLADEPRKYYLVTKSLSRKGGPMHFGAVIWGKAYVSYHLVPLYVYPELVKTIPAELKKRMQGKACFNFRGSDDACFAELGVLTKAGLEKYRAKKML